MNLSQKVLTKLRNAPELRRLLEAAEPTDRIEPRVFVYPVMRSTNGSDRDAAAAANVDAHSIFHEHLTLPSGAGLGLCGEQKPTKNGGVQLYSDPSAPDHQVAHIEVTGTAAQFVSALAHPLVKFSVTQKDLIAWKQQVANAPSL